VSQPKTGVQKYTNSFKQGNNNRRSFACLPLFQQNNGAESLLPENFSTKPFAPEKAVARKTHGVSKKSLPLFSVNNHFV
jgi:hypothetical protein